MKAYDTFGHAGRENALKVILTNLTPQRTQPVDRSRPQLKKT